MLHGLTIRNGGRFSRTGGRDPLVGQDAGIGGVFAGFEADLNGALSRHIVDPVGLVVPEADVVTSDVPREEWPQRTRSRKECGGGSQRKRSR